MTEDLHWPALDDPEAADWALPSSAAQTLEAIVRARRSVRGFLAQPVPEPLLKQAFQIAQAAPSNCNVQPWRVYVASGAARNRIRAALVEVAGQPGRPDFDRGADFKDEYRRHQVECAVALYKELGVERRDVEGRKRAFLRNYELFDAPHVAFIGMHKSFGSSVVVDVGIYLGHLMLALTAQGIASCPMGSLRNYPDVVRRELQVPEEVGILVGLCFGYEDHSEAANRTRTTREALNANVTFHD